MWAGLPFILIALPLLAGVALLVTGLRGRRVGEHPHCRACGFDLVGLPKDVQRCSECGADVTTPRAIVIGQRVRRRRRIALGVVVLLFLASGAYIGVRGSNLNPYKPTWWLRIEAQYASDDSIDAALAELATRVRAGSVSDWMRTSLVDIALAKQTGPAKKWHSGWASVVEAARASGKLSDERWLQYAHNAIVNTISLDLRPRVTRGDPIPWRFSFGGNGWRGPDPSIVGLLRCTFESAKFESDLLRDDRQRRTMMMLSGRGNSAMSDAHKPTAEALAKARDGVHEVGAVADIGVSDGNGPTLRLHLPLHASFALQPRDEQSVTGTSDPSLVDAIKRSLTVTHAGLSSQSARPLLNIMVTVKDPPVSLAMVATARVRGTDKTSSLERLTVIKLGTGASAQQTSMAALLGFTSPEFIEALHAAGDRIDIVLQPDRVIAVSTVDMLDYWTSDQPIVIEDVHVIDASTATQSTTRPAGPG